MRTLAVALVVFGHATAAYLLAGGRENSFSKLPMVRGGWIGVDLFFVLSGYFIGRQLWRELQRTGTIALRRFMIRRGLRIWPLYFFFLAFVLVVLGHRSGPSVRGWTDAVFLTNYINRGVVMGSWSLCTEEQFYILAPLLMMVGASRIKGLAGHRRYLLLILAMLPAVRALAWWRLTGGLAHHDPALFVRALYQPIHTHADGLVMGLLLANLEAVGGGRVEARRFASGWWILASVVLCLLLQRAQREVFNFTGITLVFGATVWYLISRPRPAWLGFLEWRGFYVLSRLSFGMYLNHEYMIDGFAKFGLDHVPCAARLPVLHNLAVGLMLFAASAVIAVVTFCVVEHPFLLLRDRILAGRPSRAPEEGPEPSPPLATLCRAN